MTSTRSVLLAILLAGVFVGCEPAKPYGTEAQLFLPGGKRQVWAVAPAINLSGQRPVDPILQADLLYQELQQVHGLTVIPVNRTVEALAGLHLEKVQSAEQAAIVCDALGCDALIVPTITAYDPYDPPKVGASLQVFAKPAGFVRPKDFDVHELARMSAPPEDSSLPAPDTHFLQAVGMFDAANGTVRDAVIAYARGRNDPAGPMGDREYFASMDRYCGFAYNALVAQLLRDLEAAVQSSADADSKNRSTPKYQRRG